MAENTDMTKDQKDKLVHDAFEAAEIAVDAYCKAANVNVMDIPDSVFDSFLETALSERFSPHTKMSEILPGATDKTLGEIMESGRQSS